ncbi:YybH family protein [Ferruginibacter sp.]
MKRYIFLLLVVFICSNCIAQNNINKHLTTVKKAIAKANTIYFDLYAKNDGSILHLYTADACLLPPNAPAICGSEALAKDFKDTYAAGVVKSGSFTTSAVYSNGAGYATEEGSWQVFGADGKLIDKGKYLKLWKKTKEGWQIYRDLFNSDGR